MYVLKVIFHYIIPPFRIFLITRNLYLKCRWVCHFMDIFLYSSVEGHLGGIQLGHWYAGFCVDIKFSVLFRSGNVGLWDLVSLGGGGRQGMLNCITKCLYHFKRKKHSTSSGWGFKFLLSTFGFVFLVVAIWVMYEVVSYGLDLHFPDG